MPKKCGKADITTLAPLDLPRPSRYAAPQGVVWSLTRRLCAKCLNVLGSMEGSRVTDVSTFSPSGPPPPN
jgi:hypothetical protein